MATIKIVNGKRGWHLRVNGMYIRHEFNGNVIAIQCKFPIPYGSTEWVSIEAIRKFWHKYMPMVIHSTQSPYESVWGQLISVKK